jgi:hypothetical protein
MRGSGAPTATDGDRVPGADDRCVAPGESGRADATGRLAPGRLARRGRARRPSARTSRRGTLPVTTRGVRRRHGPIREERAPRRVRSRGAGTSPRRSRVTASRSCCAPGPRRPITRALERGRQVSAGHGRVRRRDDMDQTATPSRGTSAEELLDFYRQAPHPVVALCARPIARDDARAGAAAPPGYGHVADGCVRAASPKATGRLVVRGAWS